MVRFKFFIGIWVLDVKLVYIIASKTTYGMLKLICMDHDAFREI